MEKEHESRYPCKCGYKDALMITVLLDEPKYHVWCPMCDRHTANCRSRLAAERAWRWTQEEEDVREAATRMDDV